MNHERWTDRLSDYADDELRVEEREAVDRHLAECDECRQVLAEIRAVSSRAASLSDAPPARDLWPGVAAEIGANERHASNVVPIQADATLLVHGSAARGRRARADAAFRWHGVDGAPRRRQNGFPQHRWRRLDHGTAGEFTGYPTAGAGVVCRSALRRSHRRSPANARSRPRESRPGNRSACSSAIWRRSTAPSSSAARRSVPIRPMRI